MRDVLFSVALGLAFTGASLVGQSCDEAPVPGPVAAPEAAASSGDAGCEPVDWLCCKEVAVPPTCRADGFHACEEGYVTCDLEAGSP